MPGRTSRTYLLSHLLRMLARPQETVDVTEELPPVPDCYQGRITVDIDQCRGCGLCQRACPGDALRVSRLPDRGVRVNIRHDQCAICGVCELVCPAGTIIRCAAIAPSGGNREELQETWERHGPRDAEEP